MGKRRKINYDNIKNILILQPARLSKSLQSYQKPFWNIIYGRPPFYITALLINTNSI